MIRTHSRRCDLPAKPWRWLTHALAWIVLGLSFASFSPETHALLHSGESRDSCDHAGVAETPAHNDKHVCAVVLFAQGVELPVTDQAPPAPAAWEIFSPTPQKELLLPAPRYLRHPERGPPLA